jgi:PAS domain S-box-containing protein
MENPKVNQRTKSTLLILVPAIVFVTLFVATSFLWTFSQQSIQNQIDTKFSEDTLVVKNAIETRLSIYATALYGIQGLFAASETVGRDEFQHYLVTSDIATKFPGISGVSFIQYVPASQKQSFITSIQKDTTLVPSGYPFFTIRPPGNRDEYYVGNYVPSATSSATASTSATLGLDYLTIPVRGKAIHHAVDANTLISTDILTLLGTQQNRKGFSLYLPVYKNNAPLKTLEQRRAAVTGVISSTFDANILFNTILSEEKIGNIAMSIYDTNDVTNLTSKTLLYTNQKSEAHVSGLTKVQSYSFGDQTWTIKFVALTGYGTGAQAIIPWLVGAGGVIISFLIAMALYLLINSRDRALTLAHKITEELERSEEKYRTIFTTLQDVYYRTDIEGKIVEVSPSIEHYIGIKPEQLIGRNASDFYADPMARQKMLQALQKTGKIQDYSLELKTNDQKQIFVSLTGQILFDPDRKPMGIEGILRDVSDRRKFEQELQAEKENTEVEKRKLQTLIETLPVGVVLLNPNGETILANKEAVILGGGVNKNVTMSEYEKVVKILKENGSPLPVEEMPAAIALKTGKKVENAHIVLERKDGTRITIKAISVPVKDSNGNVTEVIVVFENVTREREVDRMKTEFISLASHQLRTPLSAMKWFLEMLLGGDAGDLNNDQKEMVKNIDESNERMIDLVNSLLNVSRIESGRIIVEPVPTDLKDLLTSIQKEIEVKLQEKKQQLIVSVHSDLPKINLDPKLIREVYLNLLTNAIKYTPEGGEISVFVSRKDNELLSQISDTGYGIPAKDKEKVFKKFYRGENIVKKVTDGNGIGLYLVKSIIESSQGKIWYESTEGKGTTFWFGLPMTGMVAKKGEVTLNS